MVCLEVTDRGRGDTDKDCKFLSKRRQTSSSTPTPLGGERPPVFLRNLV